MKNWKTTLGGALGTLGTALSGGSVISAISQFNGSGNISKLTSYTVLLGAVISCIGKFFTALFAADSSEIQKSLSAQDDKINQIKEETKK